MKWRGRIWRTKKNRMHIRKEKNEMVKERKDENKIENRKSIKR